MDSEWKFSDDSFMVDDYFDNRPSSRAHKNEDEKPKDRLSQNNVSMCVTFNDTYLMKRAFSEKQLNDVFDRIEFQSGVSYHCITTGNCDSLSFLQLVIRRQDVRKMLASTWCMASGDILQFGKWIEAGRLNRCDFYVGEIFPNSYRFEWLQLNQLVERTQCGRVCCFRNHSKIYAGYGDKFPFVIESSANINTNPRTEQTCITIDKRLAEFYFEFFDKIKPVK